MLPKARKKDLIIERLEDETLVYDLKTDRAHCLNRSASLVWRSCDGKTSISKIAKRVAEKIGTAADDRFVRLALQSLQKANLIDEKSIDAPAKATVSRRELLQSIGKAAAITLPVVTSIVAPEAAQAASCIPAGECGNPGTDGRCCCGGGSCNENNGKCAKGKPCF